MMKTYGPFYGEEERRTKTHDELCQYYGLTREQTKRVTDNIPDDWNSVDLHIALEALTPQGINNND